MDTKQAFNALEQSLKLLGEEDKSWKLRSDKAKVTKTASTPRSLNREIRFSYTKGPLRKNSQEKIFVKIRQVHHRKTYIRVCEYEKHRNGLCNWFSELAKPHLLVTLAFIVIFLVFLWCIFDLISASYASESNPGTYIEAQQVENNSLITITKEAVKERNDVQRD